MDSAECCSPPASHIVKDASEKTFQKPSISIVDSSAFHFRLLLVHDALNSLKEQLSDIKEVVSPRFGLYHQHSNHFLVP